LPQYSLGSINRSVSPYRNGYLAYAKVWLAFPPTAVFIKLDNAHFCGCEDIV
jgi:hypothetical protein